MDDIVAWDPVVEAIAAQAPCWEPGTAHGYHARTYGWIVGEIIRRITGMMPGEYVAAEIAGPLGIEFFIGVPEEVDERDLAFAYVMNRMELSIQMVGRAIRLVSATYDTLGG